MFGRMWRRKQAIARHAEHPRGSQVVGAGDRRRQRLAQAREVRRQRDPDAGDGAACSDADDGRDEDRDEQRREGYRQVDEPAHRPPDATADERGHGAERDADDRAEARGQEGERDRQARRDEDAVEDVAPERIRPERVSTAGALRGRQDVDAGGVVRPQHRRDDREHDDRREA